MSGRLSSRDLAYSGLFGAAALLFPVVFHLVRLGHVFMPMYVPLVALAFFVRPLPAAVTALVVPLLSGVVTGMPPLYPPVALFMGLELAAMSGLIAAAARRWPRLEERLVLVPVLLFGRALYLGLAYAFYAAAGLPAGFMAGLSLLSGWPGLILMAVAVPPVARLRRGRARRPAPGTGTNVKAAYFDGIAGRWDGWEDLPALAARLDAGLEALGLGPDEAVLDVGCGTGNLTRAILGRLSPAGRVTAVDISPKMIEIARRKNPDPRVTWLVADVGRLPVPGASFDRVVCFSVWPHVDDRAAAIAEIERVLKPGGRLHVWHLSPRGEIDRIHASAGGVIGRDFLPPARVTAALLRERGFRPLTEIDDERGYLVDALRVGRAEA